MIKIAMYGPGHGHNIEKWLLFLSHRDEIDLTFIHYGDASIFQRKYNKVNFVRTDSVISTCLFLRKERFDLFIVQGAYSPYQSLCLSLFIKKNKMLLIPWGNGILHCFKQQNQLRKISTKILFKLADRIAAPDQLIRDIVKVYPNGENKKYEFLWGIANEYHSEKTYAPTAFTVDFLEKVGDKFFVFWPRSILRVSRYDIALDALSILNANRPDITSNMTFIIWTGNTIDDDYLKELEYKITEFRLKEVVKIVVHPFLPDSDIKEIWNRADLSLNLIDNDGFSTQLGEAFITSTPLIVNDIEAYTLVKERFNLPLEFTQLDPSLVAKALEESYENRLYQKNELGKLSTFAALELNHDTNFDKLLSDYLV